MRKNLATPKELIIEKVWGYDSDAENNHVEVYVSFLRKKLSYLNSQVVINAIRGIGYTLEVRG
jgi:two-component system response regulator ArlR